VQCSAVQCSAVQHSLQSSAVQSYRSVGDEGCDSPVVLSAQAHCWLLQQGLTVTSKVQWSLSPAVS